MKNSGFMKVFKFSYSQAMKSKSMKIMIAIIMAIALVFLPAKTLISGSFDAEDENAAQIETVYVQTDNEAFFDSLCKVVNGELESEATFTRVSEAEYEDMMKQLEADDSNDVYLKINFDENVESESFGLSYRLIYA